MCMCNYDSLYFVFFLIIWEGLKYPVPLPTEQNTRKVFAVRIHTFMNVYDFGEDSILNVIGNSSTKRTSPNFLFLPIQLMRDAT